MPHPLPNASTPTKTTTPSPPPPKKKNNRFSTVFSPKKLPQKTNPTLTTPEMVSPTDPLGPSTWKGELRRNPAVSPLWDNEAPDLGGWTNFLHHFLQHVFLGFFGFWYPKKKHKNLAFLLFFKTTFRGFWILDLFFKIKQLGCMFVVFVILMAIRSLLFFIFKTENSKKSLGSCGENWFSVVNAS